MVSKLINLQFALSILKSMSILCLDSTCFPFFHVLHKLRFMHLYFIYIKIHCVFFLLQFVSIYLFIFLSVQIYQRFHIFPSQLMFFLYFGQRLVGLFIFMLPLVLSFFNLQYFLFEGLLSLNFDPFLKFHDLIADLIKLLFIFLELFLHQDHLLQFSDL